jgi:hypothetical protein
MANGEVMWLKNEQSTLLTSVPNAKPETRMVCHFTGYCQDSTNTSQTIFFGVPRNFERR